MPKDKRIHVKPRHPGLIVRKPNYHPYNADGEEVHHTPLVERDLRSGDLVICKKKKGKPADSGE